MRREMDSAMDPVLSSDVVLGLVQKHVPGAREVRHVDETGNRARTYMIDEDLVLKTQRPSQIRPQTSLEKEVFFLDRVRAHELIQAPRVLGYGIEDGVEYTVMTRMPGVAARRLQLEGEERQRVLRDLGHMLRCVHRLDQAPFKQSRWFSGSLQETKVKDSVQQSFAAAIERLGSRPPGWTLTITTEQAARMVMDSFPSTVETVALHANPGPQHTFVHAGSRTLSGIIDFGDAHIGHPAYDFKAWSRAEDQRHIFEGYTTEIPVSEEFMAVWRSVAAVHALRMAARNGSAAVSDDLRYWLRQI